ncbi:MAG: DUF4863 family protein [Alphaproteobacteria bacterium]|nr:DUF4863 family protein [Alphaproteobacteria bacterium]
MGLADFETLIRPVTRAVRGASIDAGLAEDLNRLFPADGEQYHAIERACHAAIGAGWMCQEGGKGRRFGRVIEPSPTSDGFSVDVVDITDFRGPHHRHPTGEICMVMPVAEAATFCGHGRGWCVFEPGSDHYPEVTGGRALVLYLLPDGRIDFTE